MSIHEAPDFDREKVSIITPCHNAQDYISTTYASIKKQNHENWEWIIFDDQSKDESLKLLREIARVDTRVKVFQNTQNSGAAVTRNNCIEEATGKYLAFLDVDDLWHEKKLYNQIRFMRNNGIRFSYHPYELINSKGEVLKSVDVPATVTSKDLLKFNPFATSSVCIDKSIIDEIQLRFKEHLRRRQDYIFWFEAIKHIGTARCLEEQLSSYRVFGSESLSGNKKKMAIIQWTLYREEFKLNFMQSLYYFSHYAVHGLKKYFF